MKNDKIFSKNTLIVLPHLDDEFALAPIIKYFKSTTIIYCCERLNDTIEKRNRRRKENFKALSSLGLKLNKSIYLNNYFPVDDLKLFESSKNIFEFLNKYIVDSEQMFEQIVTLNLEGGHPDHDALALIVDKVSNKLSISKLFIPAYNNERSFLFIPLSVFKPLNSQKTFFDKYKLPIFSWISSLKIALIYKSPGMHRLFIQV